ncbi:MAG TPA: glycosyltransferase family 2 protein, partial [Anaerolineales bacterium]|nr:glycosyltransferase family 2 protein [Anaerolineales bacterium]
TDDFVCQLEMALTERDPARVAARMAVAQANTWGDRVTALDSHLRELYGRAVIVIVSYHNLDYLRLCLESIWAKTDYPNYHVIVVDNASGPDVVEYLQREQASYPDKLKVILNSENFGFARANNLGLAAAVGSEYVILLNNDTVVTRGWLSGLVRHLKADPGIGIVGPVTNWANNQAKIVVDYESLSEMDSFAARYTQSHAGQTEEVSTLAMFCVALRRSIIDQIGPLDEGFGLGMFEDDDYAMRLRRAGYRLVYARDVFVHHWGWASFGNMPQAEYDRLFDANRLRFEAKWGEPWRRPPITFGQL